MNKYEDEFALLENITARVIFYSCIAEPKTIPEIAALWDYKTSAYFYQGKTKKLIEDMEEKGLISSVKGRGGGITSNYNLLLKKEGINSLFERLNIESSNELIFMEYDYEIKPEQLNDKRYRKYLIDQKEGLRDKISKVVFNKQDIQHFLSLWEDELFKKIFLSSGFIKSYFKERRNLRRESREFVYGLTLEICDAITTETGIGLFQPQFTWVFIDEEGYQALNSEIEKLSKSWPNSSRKLELNRIRRKFEDIVKIIEQKEKVVEGEDQTANRQLRKFVQIMGFGQNERR